MKLGSEGKRSTMCRALAVVFAVFVPGLLACDLGKLTVGTTAKILTPCLNYAIKQLGDRWQSELFEAPDKVAKLAKDAGGDKRDQMMWTALALGSIVNHNLGRAETLAYLTTVKVILDRVLELD